MKSPIKYPATLLILLLTGYTQVFGYFYGVSLPLSNVKQTIGLEFLQAPPKAHKKVDFYFEEEETTRISSKEDSKNHFYSITLYACLSSYFFQRLKSYAAFSQYFSHFSYFGLPSSELCVLRL